MHATHPKTTMAESECHVTTHPLSCVDCRLDSCNNGQCKARGVDKAAAFGKQDLVDGMAAGYEAALSAHSFAQGTHVKVDVLLYSRGFCQPCTPAHSDQQ